MSTVTFRWHDPDNVTILLDDRMVGTASNDDNGHPEEAPLSTTQVAVSVAEDMAGAFGATVQHEGNRGR